MGLWVAAMDMGIWDIAGTAAPAPASCVAQAHIPIIDMEARMEQMWSGTCCREGGGGGGGDCVQTLGTRSCEGSGLIACEFGL